MLESYIIVTVWTEFNESQLGSIKGDKDKANDYSWFIVLINVSITIRCIMFILNGSHKEEQHKYNIDDNRNEQ